MKISVLFRALVKTVAQEGSPAVQRDCCKGGREELGYIGVFAENKTKKNIQSNLKRLLLITKTDVCLKLMIVVLSMYGKIQESRLIEIIPLLCILTI